METADVIAVKIRFVSKSVDRASHASHSYKRKSVNQAQRDRARAQARRGSLPGPGARGDHLVIDSGASIGPAPPAPLVQSTLVSTPLAPLADLTLGPAPPAPLVIPTLGHAPPAPHVDCTPGPAPPTPIMDPTQGPALPAPLVDPSLGPAPPAQIVDPTNGPASPAPIVYFTPGPMC